MNRKEVRTARMYEAFDSFVSVDTWHTMHPADEERFFCALRTVVTNPDFDPNRLGYYMDCKRDQGEPALKNLTEDAYNKARDHYVMAACMVKGFLQATC
ncbi:MAG: hypothetical protein AAB403_10740 [Planctomycetota bacterium]